MFCIIKCWHVEIKWARLCWRGKSSHPSKIFNFCLSHNQNPEGAHNGAIYLGKADSAASARRSYYRWVATAQKEEVGFSNREYEIEHLNSAPKTKDKKLVQKDNAIASLVAKHKSNEIGLAELLKKYILLTNEKKSSTGTS